MKSYTDIEQSKKLAKILPRESADMFYVAGKGEPIFIGNKMVADGDDDYDALGGPDVLCWSLVALLGVLPKSLIYTPNPISDGYHCINIMNDLETYGDNPIDTCYEMILKLHELNLL